MNLVLWEHCVGLFWLCAGLYNFLGLMLTISDGGTFWAGLWYGAALAVWVVVSLAVLFPSHSQDSQEPNE